MKIERGAGLFLQFTFFIHRYIKYIAKNVLLFIENVMEYHNEKDLIFNYTFLTNQTHAHPDANISIFHDDRVEHHETFYISIINRSLPFGVNATMPKAPIVIEDDDSK